MAATATFKLLLEELVEKTGVGYVLPAVTGTTAQFTLANAYGSGPWAGQRFPRGSPILTTAGTAINENTYVDIHTPSTGVTTITPAPSNTWTDGILITDKGIDHPDRLKEAINRALTERCWRWQKIPLTYVPDGEMQAVTIADYWTASAGTPTYQSLATPEMNGRVVQISHSSTAYVQSNTIPVRAAKTWRFETAIRATTDGDTATLSIQDILAGTEITATYDVGDGATTSRAFQTQRGYFTVPGTADTDARIAFRLAVSGSGTMTAQMAPIIAYPQHATSYPFNNRVLDEDRIGNFFYGRGYGAAGGPEERIYTEPITTGGREHSFSSEGDHLVVTFNFTPQGPIFYDEAVFGSALTAMTDTTTFAKEYVTRAAKFELYKYLAERDPVVLDPNKRPIRSPWERRAIGAQRALWSPELAHVYGRR